VSYTFFPGCSLEGTGADYALSARAVFAKLGTPLDELEGWICCGSTPAHNASHLLSVALPAKNLQLAAGANGGSLAVACAACYSRLKTAVHELAADAELRAKVETVTEAPVPTDVAVRHLLQLLLEDLGPDELAKRVVKPLTGLKVACYYGCLLVRPPKVMAFDDAERPTSMDRLMTALGAEPVDWPHKTECCGANLSLSRADLVLGLTDKLLASAQAAGADVLAVACPLCQANLDVRQGDVNARFGRSYALPALYFTQLVGVALGCDAAALGLDKSFVDSRPKLAAWLGA
jgi:heterodisulfide reductase subunit B